MDSTNKQSWRRVILRWTGLVAVGCTCPFVAAIVAKLVSEPNQRLTIFSPGIITALLVGQVIGIRRKELGSFLWGPGLGLLIGFADIQAFATLIGHGGIDIIVVSLLPFWGLGFGGWVCCYSNRAIRAVLVLAAIPLVDFLSRYVWLKFVWELSTAIGDWRWIAEPLVYVAPSVAAVLLTRSSPRIGRRQPQD